MTGPESFVDAPVWLPRDLTEEAERTADHLEMLQEMLADDQSDYKGSPHVTTVFISFVRIHEDGDMQLTGEEEHIGTLMGVNQGPEPMAIIANYEVWQHGPVGEDGEPQWSNMIQSADIVEVPVRLMDEILGAVGTAEDFEALKDRDQPE